LVIDVKRHIQKKMGVEVREVIPIKKIPQTTSGKLMRYKLKENYLNGEYLPIIQQINDLIIKNEVLKDFEKPSNVIEEKLLKIWSELLENENININDNFLEIGGTSLILSNFYDRIEEEKLGKVSLIDLFSYPSIKKLADFILSGKEGRYNKINFLQIKLPIHYFNTKTKDVINSKTDSIYSFKIQDSLLNSIIEISKIEKIEIEVILLSILGCHIYEITEQDEITLQVMTKNENQAEMLAINFNDINEMKELFKFVNEKYNCNKNYTYSLQNINNLSLLGKNEFSITPFFYNEMELTMKIDLLSIYDITLGLTKNNEMITLVFDYNNERLNCEKMKEFIHVYIRMIYSVVEQYDIKNIGKVECIK
jgi:surfactin family lipopeptide synthetase A